MLERCLYDNEDEETKELQEVMKHATSLPKLGARTKGTSEASAFTPLISHP